MSQGQVVDTEAAREFMQQVLQAITPEEMAAIGQDLQAKARAFQAMLAPAALPRLNETALLRSVFATRRRARELAAAGGLKEALHQLLYGGGAVADRLEAFSRRYPFDLGCECLHFTDPERRWLWTAWIWNPETETGSLRLLTMDDFDLRRPTLGSTYLRVGEAVAFLTATGEAAGFWKSGQGPFGLNVFLASVYGIYLYTVVRLRITREFNKGIPSLPEMCRRLLGVWKMEVPPAR